MRWVKPNEGHNGGNYRLDHTRTAFGVVAGKSPGFGRLATGKSLSIAPAVASAPNEIQIQKCRNRQGNPGQTVPPAVADQRGQEPDQTNQRHGEGCGKDFRE
jgi:hypothetical protein